MLKKIIEESVAAIESLDALESEVETAVDLMAGALDSGKKILACGNGGSAADSAHFAGEFLCRFIKDRRPLPAICLAVDGSLMTATANDYGYEHVFERQIEGLGHEGDVLVAITTSGNSPSVVRALKKAEECGVKSISLLGRDGGECKGLATVELIVPSEATARIQEAHKVLIHAFCTGVEARLFGFEI